MPISRSPEEDKKIHEDVLAAPSVEGARAHPKYHDYLSQFKEPYEIGVTDKDIDSATHGSHVDLASIPQVKATMSAIDQTAAALKQNVDPEEHPIIDAAANDFISGTKLTYKPGYGVYFKAPWVAKQMPGLDTAKGKYSDFLGAWKDSTNTVPATAMRYFAHRILNRQAYLNSTPQQRTEMDNAWIKSLPSSVTSQIKKQYSQGGLSPAILHSWIAKHGHIIKEMLAHQRDLHDTLQTHFKHALVQGEDGQQYLHASRGLRATSHGPEPTLASYSHSSDNSFGDPKLNPMTDRLPQAQTFKYKIPLNSVWYSYDMGPSGNLGTSKNDAEQELIVDDAHPRLPPQDPEWKTAIPGEFHHYGVEHPVAWNNEKVRKALESSLHAGKVPQWAAEIHPSHILNVLQRKDYPDQVGPGGYDDLIKKINIGPEEWLRAGAHGAEIAAHHLGAGPDTFKNFIREATNPLTSVASNLEWLISRYPHQFAPEQWEGIKAIGLTAGLKKYLADRPEATQQERDAWTALITSAASKKTWRGQSIWKNGVRI